MHKDTCETVIGKHWNEIGSIDWEGHFPILDAELRVVRVEFIDNIEADEDFMPVEIHDGRACRIPRGKMPDTDAYMTPFDFGRSNGSLLAIHDLFENNATDEKVSDTFPLYAESGTITSLFAIIDRDFYFANREAIDQELMEHARDQADREHFALADDCEPIGIALVEGNGLVATFKLIWNGEKAQSLVGMIDREPGEGDDFDPIVDKVDTEILAARNGFSAPRPSRKPCDARDAIVDALTDLRHKAHANGIDFDYALELSLMHFKAES